MRTIINCEACSAGFHNTVAEVKLCHMQKGFLIGETKVQAKAQPKVQTKVQSKPTYFKFVDRQEAEDFVLNNPGYVIETKLGRRSQKQDEAGLWFDATEKTYIVKLQHKR